MIGRAKLIGIAVLFACAGLIAGLVLSSSLGIHSRAYGEPVISKESTDFLTKLNSAMSEVAAAVRPTVVNISTTKKVTMRTLRSPFSDDFFKRFFGDEFFHQFDQPREFKETSLGSGVIVDKSGYIMTNHHVVRDADEIKITLSDKKEFIGKVIGSDPKSDLALVRIEADGLPAVKWGDSDKLKVGETIIAVGSPYGLTQTLTSGIVSAKGRANVGIADYEDFIQTDAAINPGNSGGALVNIRGELVGINTAIFSTSGGYQGIGFAIPSNMAKSVLESLIKHKKVVRGWLGVYIQPVTKEIAKQFNLKDEKGALVSDVFENSPAEKAGIQRGDMIVEYDGTAVEDPTVLRNMVAVTPPGKVVDVRLVRDGKVISVKVTMVEQPEAAERVSMGAYENVLKGVNVQAITPELRKSLNIPPRVAGVLVTEVDGGSPAGGTLQSGDVIMEVQRTKIGDVADYEKIVSKIAPTSEVLLRLFRNGRIFYLVLSP